MGRIIAAVWLLALALGVSALTHPRPRPRNGVVALHATRGGAVTGAPAAGPRPRGPGARQERVAGGE